MTVWNSVVNPKKCNLDLDPDSEIWLNLYQDPSSREKKTFLGGTKFPLKNLFFNIRKYWSRSTIPEYGSNVDPDPHHWCGDSGTEGLKSFCLKQLQSCNPCYCSFVDLDPYSEYESKAE